MQLQVLAAENRDADAAVAVSEEQARHLPIMVKLIALTQEGASDSYPLSPLFRHGCPNCRHRA